MTVRALSFVRRHDDRLEFWCAERLKSPNKVVGRWQRKAETDRWERLLAHAVGPNWGASWSLVIGTHTTKTGKQRRTYAEERRSVDIQLHYPSRRNFLKDDDNLAFTRKPLLDAMKKVGLICDDAREWVDCAMPTQHVSDDGRFWTVVIVRRATRADTAAA